MAPVKKCRTTRTPPLSDLLPALIESAIAGNDDLILTVEADPDSGTQMIHLMTGKFVTPCMLRKLIGQAESQIDEGSRHIVRRLSRDLKQNENERDR